MVSAIPMSRQSHGGMPPKWPSSPPEWNAYVEAGKDLSERRARLAEVPAPWREGVQRHVALVFKIRARLARRTK